MVQVDLRGEPIVICVPAVPKGIKAVFRNDTQFGLTIFRTQVFNPANIDNAKKIQASYKAQPLSDFLGTTPPPGPATAPVVRRT